MESRADFKSTGRSRYNSLAALGQIKFGTEDCKTIRDLVNKLHWVQKQANRLKADSIDDQVLRGALLAIIDEKGDPTFKDITTKLSMVSCQLSYSECIEELEEVERNRKGKANASTAHQVLALATQETSKPEVCRNYLQGRCKRGSKCSRIHPEGQEGTKKSTKPN